MTAPIFENAHKRGNTDKVGQLNPTGRYGVPEGDSLSYHLYSSLAADLVNTEIANAALFLASGP